MKHNSINKHEHYFYDSNDKLYNCNSNIFDIFNNKNCKSLYKKPKIFICDLFDPNKKDSKEEKESKQENDKNDKLISMVDNNEI